jgi:hypothetical protein
VLALRDVRTRVKREFPILFLAPTTTKRRKHSNPPKLTTIPSNPNPYFKPKREVRKETPKPRAEAFIGMVCGRAGHLDEFYFHCKRMEKRRFDYARNSYRDEFIDFPPHTSSHASPHFFHGPNHHSYSFGS